MNRQAKIFVLALDAEESSLLPLSELSVPRAHLSPEELQLAITAGAVRNAKSTRLDLDEIKKITRRAITDTDTAKREAKLRRRCAKHRFRCSCEK